MSTAQEEYLTTLQAALTEYRWSDVVALNDETRIGDFETDAVLEALSKIRRKRRFHELERLASMAVAAGHDQPQVRRQLAQARIEQGAIDTALTLLERMQPEVDDDPKEGPEVRGLIGRALKQRYVNDGDPADLQAAARAYVRGWEGREGDHRWHGINLVALMARADRDGVPIAGGWDRQAIANEILDEIEALPKKYVWDYATAIEASLAIGEDEKASRFASVYVGADAGADAFELGATVRQLREVWRADDTPLGAAIVKELEYQLVQREGASFTLNPRHEDNKDKALQGAEGFESVFGGESYQHFAWLDKLYGLAEGVARIHDKLTGEAFGTGFLVQGSRICEAWGDARVLVTNAHVLSPDPEAGSPLSPDEAGAEFTRMKGRPRVELGEVLFSSPKEELDCTIVRLEGIESPVPDLNPHRPVVPAAEEPPQRIYVMGHPNRGELVVSLDDNHLVGYENQYVHYRSPTDPGSSGSPVLTRKLKLLALHHRSRRDKQANEGVLLESIREQACKE